jgi:phenylacetate-CoA ligase
MATIIVWGSERDIGRHVSYKSGLGLKLLRDHVVDGYHLTSATTDRVLDIIRREGPVAIYGFTSMLEFLAQDIIDRQLHVERGTVQTAWNGGELLFPSQSELFAQAFHTSIHNRYGGRELSVMACQFHPAGPIEVLRPWLFMEVINEEGRQVSPGETGRLVWTSTVCRGTPFLRYDVEDLGKFTAAHETEAGIDALESIEGRVASVIRFPNGKSINNIYWNHLFKEYPEIRQFQVVIRTDGGLQILLRGSGFTPDRERTLRSILETFMAGLQIEFLWVAQIPLTARGKHVQVVREMASGSARHP